MEVYGDSVFTLPCWLHFSCSGVSTWNPNYLLYWWSSASLQCLNPVFACMKANTGFESEFMYVHVWIHFQIYEFKNKCSFFNNVTLYLLPKSLPWSEKLALAALSLMSHFTLSTSSTSLKNSPLVTERREKKILEEVGLILCLILMFFFVSPFPDPVSVKRNYLFYSLKEFLK